MSYLDEHHILIFLIQFFLLLGFSKLLGLLFRKWRQPTITADILAGVILGPTLLGRYFPKIHSFIFPNDIVQQNMIETVAWVGILFLLLSTGLEVNFSSIWKQKSQAFKISIMDIIVPVLFSGFFIYFLPDKYIVNPENKFIFTAFLAMIMTISAMSVSIRIMHEMNLLKTDMGFLIVSALSMNDIVGWIMFTIILAIFTQTNVDLHKIIYICVGTIGFTAFALTIGKNLINKAISKTKLRYKDHSGPSLTLICLLGLFCGAITQKIGVYPLFGFFIAGIIAGEAKDLPEQSKNTISQIVYAVFVPIFFATIGLKIDVLKSLDIPLVLFISFIGIFGRFSGAWIGSRLSKTPRSDTLPISILHIPGGEMHIVIGMLALSYGFIKHEVFIAIVAGALISCIVTGPWFAYSLKIRKKIRILDFFSKHNVLINLKSHLKEGAIKEICKLGAEIEKINMNVLVDAVMERENIMSTGLEREVAIPHARIDGITKPIIVFARSESGIEWNSIDGKPVKFIFLVVTPKSEDDVQIQIYSKIGRIMKNEFIKNDIINAKNNEDLWEIVKKGLSSHV
jgi:Kef-type K+ transport system membrane component KefB/mannitol/fructose-specific phosphotransferase system IIA component (Ntr-type)